MKEALFQMEQISKSFSMGNHRSVQALNDVTLSIFEGETLGVVGESGSGKSTLARVLMGAEIPDQGVISYRGRPVCRKHRESRLEFARKAQMIFQDAYAALNPRMTVEAIVEENLILQENLSGEERQARVLELLRQVGLSEGYRHHFPHELSGGQCQRIGIARAIAVHPELIVCDEPVSALDVSVKNQIMNLLKSLKENMGLTFLFISHDLHLVRYLSDRIAVMYRGILVELAETEDLCCRPEHPYTRLLLGAVLPADPDDSHLENIPVEGKEAYLTRQQGCVFYGRCPLADDRCRQEQPVFQKTGKQHYTACFKISGLV